MMKILFYALFLTVVANSELAAAGLIVEGIPMRNTLTFNYGTFGTTIDNKTKLVTNPTLTLPKSNQSIYFNLYIDNGHIGDIVSVACHQEKDQIKIPPIQSTVDKNGSSTLTYIFSPPPSGWPEGLYDVKASYANDATKTFYFSVQ